jgi:HlyD family secretion protein
MKFLNKLNGNKKMKKKYFIFIALTLIAVICSAMMLNGKGAKESSKFQFAEITRGDVVNTISCSGTLNAVGTVEVGTQVSGVIDRIYVDFNEKVKKGQLLAVLDMVLLKANLLDAEANYEKAVAQLEEAQANHDRNHHLYEEGFISQAEYLPYKIKLKTQQAALKSAEASLKRAEQNLKYAVISSPINGTVIQRSIEEGQTVAASLQTPTLFIIAEDMSKMEIHAQVDESDIGQIKEEQKVQFEVQAYPEKMFEGIVRQVRLQPEVVQNVVNYTVIVDANNEDGLLLPGMTAIIDFYVDEKRDVLLVPNSALRFEPSDEFLEAFRENKKKSELSVKRTMLTENGERPQNIARIWMLDDDGEPDMVMLHHGVTDGKKTEILSSRNLEEGCKVITGANGETTTSGKTNKQSQRKSGPPRLF